ncbi:MAG: hypothetical protein ACM3ZT_07020 [Bacillota bacterium]
MDELNTLGDSGILYVDMPYDVTVSQRYRTTVTLGLLAGLVGGTVGYFSDKQSNDTAQNEVDVRMAHYSQGIFRDNFFQVVQNLLQRSPQLSRFVVTRIPYQEIPLKERAALVEANKMDSIIFITPEVLLDKSGEKLTIYVDIEPEAHVYDEYMSQSVLKPFREKLFSYVYEVKLWGKNGVLLNDTDRYHVLAKLDFSGTLPYWFADDAKQLREDFADAMTHLQVDMGSYLQVKHTPQVGAQSRG